MLSTGLLSTGSRRLVTAAAVTLAAAGTLAAMTGCSTTGKDSTPAASTPAPEPGPLGVSPGGVTTRIDIPAQSTEEQYAQACMTAKEWMASKGGDPDALVEPYLKEVQAATTPTPVTFNKTWAALTQPQQAAVIIAVRAAADGGC